MPSSAERLRQYRQRHRELGLCSQCSEPVVPGLTYCARHRELNRERMRPLGRARYQQMKADGITSTPEYRAREAERFRAWCQRQRERRAEQDADA